MELTKYQRLREKVEVTGRCVSCSRHALPGNVRCRVHAEINRARSLAWRLAHPTVRAEEKQVWRDQGRCELCPEHREVEAGKQHCSECLERFRGYYDERRAGGMCVKLGCPKKAKGGVMCPEHREQYNASRRYEYFVKSGSTLRLPSGVTLGGR